MQIENEKQFPMTYMYSKSIPLLEYLFKIHSIIYWLSIDSSSYIEGVFI